MNFYVLFYNISSDWHFPQLFHIEFKIFRVVNKNYKSLNFFLVVRVYIYFISLFATIFYLKCEYILKHLSVI